MDFLLQRSIVWSQNEETQRYIKKIIPLYSVEIAFRKVQACPIESTCLTCIQRPPVESNKSGLLQ